MVLGFNQRFVQKIIFGTKRQTIRKDTKNRWKVGNTVHAAVGVRTKNYYCFMQSVCTDIRPISIKWLQEPPCYQGIVLEYKNRFVEIHVYGKLLDNYEIFRLAKNDGFDTTADFLDWFNEDFEGKIIYWEYFN